jgi:uncharacterized protein DUF6883
MQLLPNLEKAVIRIEKLRDYVLNMEHLEGRHKATVFKEVLGIERKHSDILTELLRSTLLSAAAQPGKSDQYGDSWTTYHYIVGLNAQSAVVTAAWIFKKEQSEVPQLVSCYIELQNQEKLRKLLGRA